MANVNKEAFTQEGNFFPISINNPIAYGDNSTYYNPWLRIAYKGAPKGRWKEMENRYRDEDEYNDMYLQIGNKYIRINPEFVTPGKTKDDWGTYTYVDDKGQTQTEKLTDLNVFYRHNPGLGTVSSTGTSSTSTSTPTGGYLHLNDKTAPVNTPNYGAYTYSEWSNAENPWARNAGNIRSLGNIYGDIDTAEELGILAKLQGAQAAMKYINDNSGGKTLFSGDQFTGIGDDVKLAAALLGKYAASDEGKPFYEQLRRGYASIDNMDKYAAYDAVKDWTGSDGGADKNYLNEARNSVDGRYNGARFFMDYAGDKTWGTLANEFARNNRFREDYTVNGKHVMDRLNRDAGLGDGRTLIQIYNDIITKNQNQKNLDDETRYRIFRDMTRRRFKLDNNFWNKYGLMDFARNYVYGADNIRFKDGGQIFRMLFV